MEHLPVNGKVPDSDRRGRDILIGAGTTVISGQRDYIYYSAIKSGIYDQQLRAIMAVEDSLGRVRGDIGKDLRIALSSNDTTEVERLTDAFNYFNALRRQDFKRLNEMRRDYASKVGGEYTASEVAQRTYMPVESISSSYEELSVKGKQSYYGRMVADIVSRMEGLAEGKPAPEVSLRTADGREIKISDFRGKYLLIYNFGMCSGSFQIDNRVTKLYNDHSDRIEVIGVTDSFKVLQTAYENTQDDDVIFGMNVKSALSGMLSHPWKSEVESSSANNSIFLDTYFAIGLPYFVLISPQGNIVSRAIGDETFDIAIKALTSSK